MNVIVGLGNPGKQYGLSRHNAGFMAIQKLTETHFPEVIWEMDKSMHSEVARTATSIFLKPQTFMNESGKAVAAACRKYLYQEYAKKKLDHLFILHDDLDIEVGKWKLQFGNRPKTHNGLDSIQDLLGSDQLWYGRIGVDGRQGDRSIEPQEYVLSSFSPVERTSFDEAVDSMVYQIYSRIRTS